MSGTDDFPHKKTTKHLSVCTNLKRRRRLGELPARGHISAIFCNPLAGRSGVVNKITETIEICGNFWTPFERSGQFFEVAVGSDYWVQLERTASVQGGQ